jgi:hypothetical protein
MECCWTGSFHRPAVVTVAAISCAFGNVQARAACFRGKEQLRVLVAGGGELWNNTRSFMQAHYLPVSPVAQRRQSAVRQGP